MMKTLEGKSILVVEDDRLNVMAITATLKNYKTNILVASNGNECLKKLHENPAIDLILLDLMMPEKDGYATLEELKNNELTKHIPVIILTARVVRGEKEKLIQAGASDYFEKPILYDKLLCSIKSFC